MMGKLWDNYGKQMETMGNLEGKWWVNDWKIGISHDSPDNGGEIRWNAVIIHGIWFFSGIFIKYHKIVKWHSGPYMHILCGNQKWLGNPCTKWSFTAGNSKPCLITWGLSAKKWKKWASNGQENREFLGGSSWCRAPANLLEQFG